MKNILWLVSWYPNRVDPTDGNFVQRQAKAVSQFANIHVLYIHPVETGTGLPEEVINRKDGNLTEEIIYYNSPAGIFRKLNSINRYYSLAKKHVSDYVKKNGIPDYVHVHVPIRAGTIALWMKKKFKVNYALTEHYGIYNDYAIDRFEKRSFFYQSTVRKIIKNAHPFICVSNELGEQVNAVAIKKEFIVIPNVVDTGMFKFKEKEQANARFRFLHVSNMLPVKNAEGIIDAVELLLKKRNDFELRLVGRHPEHVFTYAEKSGLLNTHIFFTGEVPYPQVATEMQQADTFILFSHSEGGACVIEETLCCGLPVISTPVGNKERVDKDSGLLVNIDDSNSLAEKMETMINNKTQYNRRAISERFTKQLSYEAIGKRIMDCYNN